MKICFSCYELERSDDSAKRHGALLKVEFEEGMVGYADCHPWPELGDVPLQAQLDLLAHDKRTAVTDCALAWAYLDASARKLERPLSQKVPKCHYLIPDFRKTTAAELNNIQKMGFTHVKIKMKGWENGLSLVRLFSDSGIKIRLDFNESLTPKTFHEFLETIDPLKEQIDFIEDPFPFQSDEWRLFQERGWRLACDRQMMLGKHYPEAASILILKPAIQPFDVWAMNCRQTAIVTSYLGHPLEQVAAAFAATTIDPQGQHVHGLLSHVVYQPNAFSRHLNWYGPQFSFPKENGFGFEPELEAITWSVLR